MPGYNREAELQALYGGDDGLTLISGRGGRKRDKRKTLTERMGGLMAGRPETSTNSRTAMPTDAPTIGSYQTGSLGEIASRMAGERGLDYMEGRRPGSMFVKGPGGEKLALQGGDEFLDLISVGGGKEGRGKEMFQFLDELGTEGGSQVRRGTTNLSEAGQRSIEKGVQSGRLVRNPAGSGWLSTAQKAGRRAADAAKGAVGGLTALLEPYFGALQDPSLPEDLDPEMRQTLEGILGLFSEPDEGRPQG